MPKISESARAGRQEAICQAAVTSLARHGYAGTSMRTVAEAAGMTKGALYAYYDSKEAILLAVAERYMEQQLAAFEALPCETAAAQLERVMAQYEKPPGDADVQRAILDLWVYGGEVPAVQAALAERYQRYLGALAGIVRRGQESGDFQPTADPALVAGLILAARDGMVFQAVKLGAPVPVTQLTALVRTLLTRYLRK